MITNNMKTRNASLIKLRFVKQLKFVISIIRHRKNYFKDIQVFVLTKPLDTINFSDLLENMFNSHEVFFSGYIC